MKANLLEEFQLSLRECCQIAAKTKNLRLPDGPVFGPVKVVADLILALAPLDFQLQLAVDELTKNEELSLGVPGEIGEVAKHFRCHSADGSGKDQHWSKRVAEA